MLRAAPYLLLAFMVALFGALVLVSSGKLPMQVRQRQLLRERDVKQIAQFIDEYQQKTGIVPTIPGNLVQLGTGTSDCRLHTAHCAIDTDQCLNLNTLTLNDKQTFPADIQIGSLYKSGYAVSLSGNTLTVVACGAESTPIHYVRE